MKQKLPFYGAKGSDPNAVMRGDNPQQITRSTAPMTKPKRPVPVKSGGVYKLPRLKGLKGGTR
jgi:hypothetical protein